ncbi:hypothetical protein NGB36_09170 [Streptomyces sp. RB6PN25]|uniref:Uncharacterized protein n=1 Tax=Streptomyces humicola TaxID=2953240 RepID=A0ABT1PSX3_9ACTN|nr:hypothetical protein [Streptomyces humicola]MCQ4080769.1 hypothetical protein [Streptomyces humicola]
MNRLADTPPVPGFAACDAGPAQLCGREKAARQGVLSALHPDPQQVVIITGIRPGLHVRMTGRPVADWLCACGHHERARGRTAVVELTDRVRVGHCPHRATSTNQPQGRAA